MSEYVQEKNVALEAARLAGKLCMAIRQEKLSEAGVEGIEKAGKEPVTIADYGAQAVVLHHIAHHFPDDGVIAEEGAADFVSLTTASQKSAVTTHVGRILETNVTHQDIEKMLDFGSGRQVSRVWTVDPIDGTKGFLRGDQFAVAVALLEKGVPVVGALCCPVLSYDPIRMTEDQGVVAIAVKGQGATLGAMTGQSSRPLHVSSRTGLAQSSAVESVESGHTDHSFSQQVLQEAGVGGKPVRMDSQAKYVAVADGRAELYIRNSRGGYKEKIWDHAAGVLVVLEAKGRVTDLDGKPLDFSLGAKLFENRGVLATNNLLHGTLLEAIGVVESS